MLAYFNTTTHFSFCFIADNESKKNERQTERKKEYDNHRKYAYIFLTTQWRPLSTQWIPLTYLSRRNDYIAVAAVAAAAVVVILAMVYTPHVSQHSVQCTCLWYHSYGKYAFFRLNDDNRRQQQQHHHGRHYLPNNGWLRASEKKISSKNFWIIIIRISIAAWILSTRNIFRRWKSFGTALLCMQRACVWFWCVCV